MAADRFREEKEYDERVVDISRVAKVVKGGRRFGFRSVVVVGDGRGRVGIGVGKARDVASSIRKGFERARRSMIEVHLVGSTIPHKVISSYGAAQVMLKPASPGTGVIAGSAVRAVLEACGIGDVLTKSLGSSSVLNVVRATMKGLQQLRDPRLEAEKRGKELAELGYRWSKDLRRDERETVYHLGEK